MADQAPDSAAATQAAVARAAKRARVALPAGAAGELAPWLRAELEALARTLGGTRPGPEGVAVGVGAGGMPLRADGGPPYAMVRPLAFVAPTTRLGLVLVPRLAPAAVVGSSSAAPHGAGALGDDAFTAELAVGP